MSTDREPLTMTKEREAAYRDARDVNYGELLAEITATRAALQKAEEALVVQSRIAVWADATFGQATADISFRRFDEEDGEFTLANQDPEEAADIMICLFRWAAVKDVDLLAETEKKLSKCMAREWELNGDGTGHRKDATSKQAVGLRQRLTQVTELARELLAALELVWEDFVECDGCYCGQMVGGTDKEGNPRGVCGSCLTLAVTKRAQALLGPEPKAKGETK